MYPDSHNANATPQRYAEFGSSTSYLLGLMGQETTGRLRKVWATHDLKPRQFQILSLLADRGPTGQRELGEIMATDHSILVMMLNPLEADRLIERRRSCSDRRRHVVNITSTGVRRLAAAAQAQHEAEEALFAGLTSHQRQQLRDLLVILRDTSNPQLTDDHCE
jgi:MarR family transcriptional regulator, lower aerobic nicotinate degradation pathway regulator